MITNKINMFYLRAFWFFVFITSLAFFVTALFAFFSLNNYEFSLTYSCFNFLLSTVFLMPLVILVITLPLCAFLLVLHRSEQTQYQLKQVNHQNLANTYLMHKQEFVNLCKELEFKHGVKIDARKIYLKLFPNNSYDNVELTYLFQPILHTKDFFQWSAHVSQFSKKMSAEDYKCNFDDARLMIKLTSITAWEFGLQYKHNSPKIKVDLMHNGVTRTYPLINENLNKCWIVFFKIADEFATFARSTPHFTELKYVIRLVDSFIEQDQRFEVIDN